MRLPKWIRTIGGQQPEGSEPTVRELQRSLRDARSTFNRFSGEWQEESRQLKADISDLKAAANRMAERHEGTLVSFKAVHANELDELEDEHADELLKLKQEIFALKEDLAETTSKLFIREIEATELTEVILRNRTRVQKETAIEAAGLEIAKKAQVGDMKDASQLFRTGR